MRRNKNNTRYIVMLIIIVITCLLFYELVYESSFGRTINRKMKHILNFVWFALIGIFGNIGLKTKYTQSWLINLWIFIYTTVGTILLISGIIDWILGNKFGVNYNLMLGGIRYFLTSPMPFLLFYFLNKLSKDT